ncbi:MAG: hypothetical protein M1136_01245, partial [Chloroflexi bacterium]|nr:hypothetical protein [Chloroflexota bacterium]
MALRLIYKQDLPSFLESLKAYGELVGPVRKNGGFVFARIDAIEEMASDHPITITPPKKYFFPQTETLFRFKTGEEVSIEPTLEAPRRIIFGIHPCDIHATWLLDQAFSDHVPDTYYLQKRERAIIIGMDCLQPCDEYSFCRSMGTFTVESGFDLLLTDINDAYAVQTGSIEGEGLLLRWGKDKEAVYERRNRLRAVQREKTLQ